MVKKKDTKRRTHRNLQIKNPVMLSSKNRLSDDNGDAAAKYDIKYGTGIQAAWGMFREYCGSSSIHGMRYLGERNISIIERFTWIIIFIMAIFTCGFFIQTIWHKWQTNPVIVSFDEKTTPVWDIPFPAVTLCAETKFLENSNFTKTLDRLYFGGAQNLTEKELKHFSALLQVCESNDSIYNYTRDDFVNSSEFIEALSFASFDFKTDLSGTWLGKEFHSDFHKTLTEDGLCYSFNAFDPKDIYREEALASDVVMKGHHNKTVEWSLDEGYYTGEEDTFPYRMISYGVENGLHFFIPIEDINNLDQGYCRSWVPGFKMLLHIPGEVPQMLRQFFPIPFNQELLISVKPKIIKTSELLRHYKPISRQCYFQEERHLRYFKVYTQSNCELECLSNFTMKMCGCIKFSMPAKNSKIT